MPNPALLFRPLCRGLLTPDLPPKTAPPGIAPEPRGIPTVGGADIRGIPIGGRLAGGDVERRLESLLSIEGDEDRDDLDAWNYVSLPPRIYSHHFRLHSSWEFSYSA
jgi:hypothetical protein